MGISEGSRAISADREVLISGTAFRQSDWGVKIGAEIQKLTIAHLFWILVSTVVLCVVLTGCVNIGNF